MIKDKTDELPQPLKEYLPTYFEHRVSEIPEFESFLATSNFEGIRALCHKIVGSAASYKLFELEVIARKLQNAAKSDDIESSISVFKELQSYLSSKGFA